MMLYIILIKRGKNKCGKSVSSCHTRFHGVWLLCKDEKNLFNKNDTPNKN